MRFLLLGVVVMGLTTVGPTWAQGPPVQLAWASGDTVPDLRVASDTSSLDYRVLALWYRQQHPFPTTWMWAADRTAYPVFYGSPLVVWGLTALGGMEAEAAYRFSLAHASAVGGTFVLKQIFKRQRPYVRHTAITARRTSDIDLVERPDPHSFPSGHTALAVALATTLALEYPEPYVVIPATAWAGSIGLSRVWLGLHYPSDVLLGGLMGGGLAWAIHWLGDQIVPARLR